MGELATWIEVMYQGEIFALLGHNGAGRESCTRDDSMARWLREDDDAWNALWFDSSQQRSLLRLRLGSTRGGAMKKTKSERILGYLEHVVIERSWSW